MNNDKKTVMIVDDSPYIVFELETILEEMGFDIIARAETGEDAVQMAKDFKPDIITLDIILPGISGIDALKQIIAEFPQTKIVMISAAGSREILFECLRSGAVDFIDKPFVKQKIFDTMIKL